MGQLMSLGLVGDFPDFEEANGRMEAVEDGQRHGDVGDDRPAPDAEELQMGLSEDGASLDQGVHEPDGYVGHQQEGDDLPARLPPHLFVTLAPPMTGVQDEHGLQRSLHHSEHLCYNALHAIGHCVPLGKVTAQDAEHSVQVDPRLGHNQQQVVQVHRVVVVAIVLDVAQIAHEDHACKIK